MRKTTVEIDDDLIARVRVLLGTSTIKDTIDTALREVERQEARLREIRALIEMDGIDLADERVMANTWRY
ncbi:MAG: type II toxin-antitoxin system VapB family antitoxin [Gemmatimonadetes bacterium]|nr:type II toxin-antitoxin system VapB family antitoxin [Gemmatimonadota bacterium]